jgi:hypothetical protein
VPHFPKKDFCDEGKSTVVWEVDLSTVRARNPAIRGNGGFACSISGDFSGHFSGFSPRQVSTARSGFGDGRALAGQ